MIAKDPYYFTSFFMELGLENPDANKLERYLKIMKDDDI